MKSRIPAIGLMITCLLQPVCADDLPRAFIDGTGPGWMALGEKDLVNVNCASNTWSFANSEIHCTGQPTGIIRSVTPYTNFELVVEWCHRRSGGNSGIFLWVDRAEIDRLTLPGLPHGIEVQVLDPGFAAAYKKKHHQEPDWFTCHGDVFPVGKAKMTPFPPAAPNGQRSFPSKYLSRGVGEWNHYYVRAINGEVRLWVNGEEVSGGTDCEPRSGFLCLESEGAPVTFRKLRIRPLP